MAPQRHHPAGGDRRVALAAPAADRNANSLTPSPSFAMSFARWKTGRVSASALCSLPGHLAREYSAADISPTFKPNGTFDPGGDEYNAHVAQNFANWRLRIDGMVSHPLSLSVSEIRACRAHPDHAA